jgi:hypothetical protein
MMAVIKFDFGAEKIECRDVSIELANVLLGALLKRIGEKDDTRALEYVLDQLMKAAGHRPLIAYDEALDGLLKNMISNEALDRLESMKRQLGYDTAVILSHVLGGLDASPLGMKRLFLSAFPGAVIRTPPDARPHPPPSSRRAAAIVACAAMPAAATIEAVETAIVVTPDAIPLGATITDWMPGVPYVRGEVVRWGSRLYWCHDFLAEKSGQHPSSS